MKIRLKEFRQVLVVYSLFTMGILAVIFWSLFQDYKHGEDFEKVEYQVDTIVVYKDINLLSNRDWDNLTKAIVWVESKGKHDAMGGKDDVGVLQIRPIIVEDCNRIVGYEKFVLKDRLDSLKSVEMFNVIQNHYNPQHDFHWALKLWNSGAPLSYHRKIMDKFNEIKNN